VVAMRQILGVAAHRLAEKQANEHPPNLCTSRVQGDV